MLRKLHAIKLKNKDNVLSIQPKRSTPGAFKPLVIGFTKRFEAEVVRSHINNVKPLVHVNDCSITFTLKGRPIDTEWGYDENIVSYDFQNVRETSALLGQDIFVVEQAIIQPDSIICIGFQEAIYGTL